MTSSLILYRVLCKTYSSVLLLFFLDDAKSTAVLSGLTPELYVQLVYNQEQRFNVPLPYVIADFDAVCCFDELLVDWRRISMIFRP